MESKTKPFGMRIGESVFSLGYLVFAWTAGIILLLRGCTVPGIMILVLGGGDSFHLVPRIVDNLFPLKRRLFLLGLGNLISSITMTVFYILLFFAVFEMCSVKGTDYTAFDKFVIISLSVLGAVRIALCLIPSNNWFDGKGNVKWSVIRNVPFAVMGLFAVAWLIYKSITLSWKVTLLAVLVVLSFGFYIPVVLFARKRPMIGMLMIPKTICYIVMICIFL